MYYVSVAPTLLEVLLKLLRRVRKSVAADKWEKGLVKVNISKKVFILDKYHMYHDLKSYNILVQMLLYGGMYYCAFHW